MFPAITTEMSGATMDPLLHSLPLVCVKSGQLLLQLLPYVLFGVMLGEVLKLTSWTKLVYKGATKSPVLSVPVAAFLGMTSPLCTFGTVPVVIQLLRAGVPIGPLAAFLATSAMMNPQLFILTWGGLGAEMAVIRSVSVFLFGLLLGGLLHWIPSRWIINQGALTGQPKRDGGAAASIGQTGDRAATAFTVPSGNMNNVVAACREDMGTGMGSETAAILGRRNKRFIAGVFVKNVLESLQFVGFYMVIGILLGAVVEVFVPGYWITFLFQPGSWVSVMLAGLMGVPLYACGGGVIPLVRSFLEEGMTKGAALAFLIVGPATRVTPLTALASVLRLTFLVVYLILLIVFSFVAGLLYR